KPKEKESIFTMLRAIPALRKQFGKVHVSFGEAIRLDDVLNRHDPDNRRAVEKIERPVWLSTAVDELATRIMTNINGAACVAPMNLIALALLATPKQSMLESDLIRQLALYASLLRQAAHTPAEL